jgi:hypothetical protein
MAGTSSSPFAVRAQPVVMPPKKAKDACPFNGSIRLRARGRKLPALPLDEGDDREFGEEGRRVAGSASAHPGSELLAAVDPLLKGREARRATDFGPLTAGRCGWRVIMLTAIFDGLNSKVFKPAQRIDVNSSAGTRDQSPRRPSRNIFIRPPQWLASAERLQPKHAQQV